MDADLAFAFRLADIADAVTMRWWSPSGIAAATKDDGSPVTVADIATEEAIRDAVGVDHPDDGFLGEEVGEQLGSTGRRWIVDGIDGTRFFAAGSLTWGTLIALEVGREIVLGVSSSPAQDRRWWASRGQGAFTGRSTNRSADRRIHVSAERQLRGDRVTTLPSHDALPEQGRRLVQRLLSGPSTDLVWSHANRVAEGQIDLAVWFGGDIWDHAAPSILVEEAGGRFSDHWGGKRLDTRTAIYSNRLCHDDVLEALEVADRPQP